MKHIVRDNRGMTLIEIMIVLVIVGGLMSILVTQIVGKLSNAQLKQVKIHMGEIGKSLDMFYTDCGFYPSSGAGLKALTSAPAECKNWGPEPYMKGVPMDPWGTEYIYESKGSNYVLKSLGADRQEGGSGKDKDISSEEL